MSDRTTEETIKAVEGVLPGESATARAAHESLKGDRRGIRKVWPFLGPAFVAAVAYVDPGNFATNISAGAQFGYLLLWVILCSNLMAMLIQSMSAKLGIATGKTCRRSAASDFRNRSPWGSGCRRRLSRWLQILRSSSARLWP
jgi:Mn2+/Fe2+ NRAMP family transporter